MPFLEVKHDGFEKLKRFGLVSSDRALAKLIGVDPATLSRVLRGKTEPTGKFIAGTIHALGMNWFEHLFEVVDERKPKCTEPDAPTAPTLISPKAGARPSSVTTVAVKSRTPKPTSSPSGRRG